MDNVTHSLTGALLARAGLSRWMPGAVWVLLAASNVPDSDIVTSFLGAVPYLEYHRHLTHALAAIPIMALLVTGALFWLPGWRFVPAFGLSCIGVAVHIVMDLTNAYGVRIWLPFRSDWVQWDLTFIVEPWVLAVYFLCLAAPWLSGLVGGEIGVKQKSAGRGWAVCGLLFFVVWCGGRYVQQQRAMEVLRSRTYQGLTPQRVAAWPTPWNPLAWRGYVATEELWALYDLNLVLDFDPDGGQLYFKPQESTYINAAQQTPEAQAFLRFAQFPVWRMLPVDEPENGKLLEATDVRFGRPEDGKFQLRVVLDGAGKPVSSIFGYGNLLRGTGVIRE